MQDFGVNAHRLLQQLNDPTLSPSQLACVRAEMKAAVVSMLEKCTA